MHRLARPVLTSDRVRYVGDPVAIVAAETAVQAKDAAETVFLDIASLPGGHSRERSGGTGCPATS
jgi:carbon-monoxide dehydrogenase large subunit